jgi:hypothetical protein
MTTDRVPTAGDLGLPDGGHVPATVVQTAVPHHPCRPGAESLVVGNPTTVRAGRSGAGEAR